MNESQTVRDLQSLLDMVSGEFPELTQTVEHAIAMARECDYQANQASNMSQTWIAPAYPPLVAMLALAAPTGRRE